MLSERWYYNLIVNNNVVDIKARYHTVGNGRTGIKITWDIECIIINSKKTGVYIKQVAISALESYGNIHFGGHIISTDFANISDPYYK